MLKVIFNNIQKKRKERQIQKYLFTSFKDNQQVLKLHDEVKEIIQETQTVVNDTEQLNNLIFNPQYNNIKHQDDILRHHELITKNKAIQKTIISNHGNNFVQFLKLQNLRQGLCFQNVKYAGTIANREVVEVDDEEDKIQVKPQSIFDKNAIKTQDIIDDRSQKTQKQYKNLVQQIQKSTPDFKSKYYPVYDTFADLDIKDNVEFFKDFRKEYKINDVALFGYFSLKDVRELYKNEYRILSFMLEDTIIQQFREYFDENKKYQKLFTDYFNLSYTDRCYIVGKTFGEDNINFFIDFYPLYDLFVMYAGIKLKKKYEQSIEISNRIQIKEPHLLFPEARKIKRKIIYHYGPTNSGKTHSALNYLMNSPSGIYCGPLRLLATEIYQKFQAKGINCNLITGQEKIIEPNSKFYSCTTEIASLKTDLEFDCAVIDEIQYLGDPERGGAWTQAFLGLKAKEIHVCGDGRVLQLIKDLCKQTGDKFEKIQYQRMSELKVQDKEYKFPDDLQEGVMFLYINPNIFRIMINENKFKIIYFKQITQDCFVCFSVAETIAFKQKVNKHLNGSNKQKDNHCSIIYGRQPADIKKVQSEMFNKRTYKYLVATNAIGLGLNLNIKRIIFHSFTKIMQSKKQNIDKNEILQIAGRAGRFKEDGVVCARNQNQINLLKETLNERDEIIQKQNIKKAAFFPQYEQIETFGKWLNQGLKKKKKLSEIFQTYVNYVTCSEKYFIQNEQDFCFKAALIENVGLSMSDQFIFSQAPIRMGMMFEKERELFKIFAKKYSLGQQVELPQMLRDKDKITNVKVLNETLKDKLTIYESLYFILELYIWLGNKFGVEHFPDMQLSQQQKLVICEIMNQIHVQNQYQ